VDPEAMIVKVKAQQFSWSFEYPEYGGFVSSELHLPKDKQVLLKMESTDVIHSFWVPEFRVKQDIVPGRVTELRITPTLVGTYTVRCAELCGAAHYAMEKAVVVTEFDTFQQWALEQQANAALAAQSPEARGELLAKTNCISCHSVTAAALPIAPSWFGLFGSTSVFEDGSSVVVDEAYLQESIVNPLAKVVQGYQPVMPATYGSLLSESEIADIIAYIKTLK
jgi:cytochrome c oxidase subunit 2